MRVTAPGVDLRHRATRPDHPSFTRIRDTYPATFTGKQTATTCYGIFGSARNSISRPDRESRKNQWPVAG